MLQIQSGGLFQLVVQLDKNKTTWLKIQISNSEHTCHSLFYTNQCTDLLHFSPPIMQWFQVLASSHIPKQQWLNTTRYTVMHVII